MEAPQCKELDVYDSDQESQDCLNLSLPNNEILNLKNAEVIVDNSSEVTIGPVTNIHVNGNVKFVQNSLLEKSVVNKISCLQQIGNKAEKDKVQEAQQDTSEPAANEGTNYANQFHAVADTVLNVIKRPFFAITTKIAEVMPKENTTDNNQPNTLPDNSSSILWSNYDHNFLTKRDWGGVPATSYEKINRPIKLIIIKHVGAGKIENTFKACANRMITIQSENMGRGFPDIYCNFFIGGDGNIYVGRGWDAQPQWKKDTIDIVFSGNFSVDRPLPIMISAAQILIRDGVAKGKIDPDYLLVAHKQTVNTLSPGVHLCEEIRKWDHYHEGLFFGNKLPLRTLSTESSKMIINWPT